MLTARIFEAHMHDQPQLSGDLIKEANVPAVGSQQVHRSLEHATQQVLCAGGMCQGSKQLQQFSLEVCSAASVQRETILPPEARAIAPIGFIHPDVCRSCGMAVLSD